MWLVFCFALALQWKDADGVSVPLPPAEHPRLYLRARDLPDLKRRTGHPVLKPVWERLQALGTREPAIGLEVDALRYLLDRDASLARRTAAATLKLMQETTYDRGAQDVTRPIGRRMVTGAIVYDWCYPELTPEQKAAFVAQFQRYAKELECGYPPPKASWITGHYSEWMLMRDMLSAGLAIYDEFPEMYLVAANRFFGGFLPVRNWWYPGGAFHQGSAYAETRFSSDLYPLWIFHRMGLENVYNRAQQFVPYQWIYMRRPDGQLLRAGDGQSKAPKLRSLLTASYYHDGYVLGDYLRDPGIDPYSMIFEFLWRDPDLQPRPATDLPLSRYMGTPYGWMVARTGWDERSVIAEMKVNVYNFNNHQHLDAGAFQVYYKGPLAIDSGLYQGSDGGYGSAHDVNYNKRTIAHNSLLVYDPKETFARSGRTHRNDGGQHYPNGWREPRSLDELKATYRTGEVLAHGFGPDPVKPLYTYLKGDITRAYSDKLREARRSFVFLNLGGTVPAALVVFDKVRAADPTFRKYWLLHAMEEPKIDGNRVTIAPTGRGWTGKLVNTVLLPRRPEIAAIGGPGKEFWVFGENFPNQPTRGNPNDYEIGAWRVEVSGTAEQFLNVMQVMDRGTAPLAVESIEAPGLTGARIANNVVLFGGPLAFSLKGQGTLRCLVTDLAAGSWQLLRNGVNMRTLVVSEDAGAAWFEGPAGDYTLQR